MRRLTVALACVSLAFGALARQAPAQVPAGERTLVSDPDQLERMGFPRDTTNVYIGNRLSTGPAQPEVPTSPSDFGPASHYTPVNPKAFIGRENTAGSWQYSGGAEGCCMNLSRTGSELFADAAVDLPTGTRLDFFRWWANDSNAASDIGIFAFETCHPSFGAGASTTTLIFSADPATTGSSGNQSNVLTQLVNPYVVNNRDCRVTVRVRFDATTGLTLQKIRAQWIRQVSPSPAVATFTDVPLAHPFNKFVEALAASGITGGCGGGLYCPDSPVTRGQMAVFLSAALGLNWP